MSTYGVIAHQRNLHQFPNSGTTLKRRFDNRSSGVIGDFQEDRIRYAPPQKRPRSQTHGEIPLNHHGCNVSRVSNYRDDVNCSNSSNRFPFTLHNNNDYQKPYGYGNPNNPKLVPFPLPYRNLYDNDNDLSFDSLPEWIPNRSSFPIKSLNSVLNTNRNITGERFNDHHIPSQAPLLFTNYPNPMPMNNSNMISIVSQAMVQQPIVTKALSELLSVINNEKEKQSSCNSDNEPPLGLSFEGVNLNIRHEPVINSLYSDMSRQCSSCGVRFKCQEDHSNHMDWHVRKNRMAKDTNKTLTRFSQKPKTKSRDWLVSSSLWLSAGTGATVEAAGASFHVNGETQKEKEEEEQQHTVRADENQKMCGLCLESFEEFFSHEDDDWMYKDAVYLNKNDLGPIVHAKCMH